MKNTSFGWKKLFQGKYNQLLIILIANFVLSPVLKGSPANIGLSIVFLYAIILIVRTFSLKPKLLTLYSSVAILALILNATNRLGWYQSWLVSFVVLIQLVYAVYLGLALYWILQDILSSPEVTPDVIRGGICVYLLIGVVWALLYGILTSIDPNALSESILVEEESFGSIMYFSYTTLTGLGYGDILPLSPLARMLTNLEAVVGQLYPSIFIAILIGGYMSQRSK